MVAFTHKKSNAKCSRRIADAGRFGRLPVGTGLKACLLAALFIGACVGSVQAADALPFQRGERLEYILKWSILPVGHFTAELVKAVTKDAPCHSTLVTEAGEHS